LEVAPWQTPLVGAYPVMAGMQQLPASGESLDWTPTATARPTVRTFDDSQTEALLNTSTVALGRDSGSEIQVGLVPSTALMISVAIISDDSLVEAALRARLRGGPGPGLLLALVDDPRHASVLVWDARAVEHDEEGLPVLPMAAREPVRPTLALKTETPPSVVALLPDGDIDPLPLLAAGVRGLVARDASPSRLRAAIEAVHRGLIVLDEDPGDALIAAWSPEPIVEAAPNRGRAGVDDLTPREHEVLTLLADGLSNRAIADALRISAHTVKFHVDGLLDKLSARSRTHAVVEAVRRGLLELA
jgi:two-component system nitrate/nitrite response regulator NarL